MSITSYLPDPDEDFVPVRQPRTRERGPDKVKRTRKPAKGEQPYRATIAFRIEQSTADAFKEDPDWAEVLRAFVRNHIK